MSQKGFAILLAVVLVGAAIAGLLSGGGDPAPTPSGIGPSAVTTPTPTVAGPVGGNYTEQRILLGKQSKIAQIRQKTPDRALADVESDVTAGPPLTAGMLALVRGMIHETWGRTELAEREYTQALKADASLSWAHAGLGRLAVATDARLARQRFEQAIAVWDGCLDGYEGLLHLDVAEYRATGSQEALARVLANAQKATTILPSLKEVWLRVLSALKEMNRPDLFATTVADAMKNVPDAMEDWYEAHVGYLVSLAMYDDAIALIDRWAAAPGDGPKRASLPETRLMIQVEAVKAAIRTTEPDEAVLRRAEAAWMAAGSAWDASAREAPEARLKWARLRASAAQAGLAAASRNPGDIDWTPLRDTWARRLAESAKWILDLGVPIEQETRNSCESILKQFKDGYPKNDRLSTAVRLLGAIAEESDGAKRKTLVTEFAAFVQAGSKEFLTDPAVLPAVLTLMADSVAETRELAAQILTAIASRAELRSTLTARLAAEADPRALLAAVNLAAASADSSYAPHLFALTMRLLAKADAIADRASVLGSEAGGVFGALRKLSPESARQTWPKTVTEPRRLNDPKFDALSRRELTAWYTAVREAAKWPPLGADGLPVFAE